MQALAAGYSGYAGASCCCFLEKGFKNCLTNTFEKACTSDAEVSDVQLSSPQRARRSVLTREICGLANKSYRLLMHEMAVADDDRLAGQRQAGECGQKNRRFLQVLKRSEFSIYSRP
jgi:hypothetical protein